MLFVIEYIESLSVDGNDAAMIDANLRLAIDVCIPAGLLRYNSQPLCQGSFTR
jgi:hypothetical protein